MQVVGGGFVPGIIFNQTEPGLVYVPAQIVGQLEHGRRDDEAALTKELLDNGADEIIETLSAKPCNQVPL